MMCQCSEMVMFFSFSACAVVCARRSALRPTHKRLRWWQRCHQRPSQKFTFRSMDNLAVRGRSQKLTVAALRPEVERCKRLALVRQAAFASAQPATIHDTLAIDSASRVCLQFVLVQAWCRLALTSGHAAGFASRPLGSKPADSA